MCNVVIVIPIYKRLEDLKYSEQASLTQLHKKLKKFDICFIAPEKLRGKIENYDIRLEYFSNGCFDSVRAYSHLLLTEEFYNRFSTYEYMLLYQLDSFVFSDRLQEFCNMNYDYIGAPMPTWTGWKNMKVGNGGFSLRKISSCLRVVKQKKEIYERTGMEEECEWAEDKFFGLCGADKDIYFSVPDTKTALKFAIEYDVMRSYDKLSKDNLPFGCHAWSKAHYWRIWEPYISENISNWQEVRDCELMRLPYTTYREIRRMALIRFLVKRYCVTAEKIYCDRALERVMPTSEEYLLWGIGKVGQETLDLLKVFPRNIKCFVDSNTNIKEFNNIDVLSPKDALQNWEGKIIVSVTKSKYVSEITTYLQECGFKRYKDFILYSDLVKTVIESYWQKSVHKWGRRNEL